MTSDSASQHRNEAANTIYVAVVTVSDTRTLETDRGGQTILDLIQPTNHQVISRVIVRDEPQEIVKAIDQAVRSTDTQAADAVLITGGTGISARDQTYETITNLLDKPIPGYGELFRMLSYDEIGAASMLSRATGGIREDKVILTMPGSTAAVKLAMEKLIIPELAHLVHEATK